MQPYIIAEGKNNKVECNADLVILDGGSPVLMSLIDIGISNRKVCSDLIQGRGVTLKDRENIDFNERVWSYNSGRYRFKSEKQGYLTHTMIYNTRIDEYMIDWNNEGLVTMITRYLNNKLYLPVTQEIVEKILKYIDKENEKYTYSSYEIHKECQVYTIKDEFKNLKCYKLTRDIKYYFDKIDLEGMKDDGFNWDEIETIEDYILKFIDPIKNKLNENINVLYDEKKINQNMFSGKKKPFKGQVPIVQSAIEVLKNDKFVYTATQQGTGKTVLTSKIIDSYYKEIGKDNPVIFAQVPAITLSQWKDEIKDCVSSKVNIIVIKKTNEFIKLYNETKLKFDKPTYILCGKETFKLQYKLKPAINIRTQKIKYKHLGSWYASNYSRSNMPDYAYQYTTETLTIACCPSCGKPLKNPLKTKEDVFFSEKDFKGSPKKSNYKCGECNGVLWSATYDKTKKTSVIDFIKRKKIKFDCVVIDECQESNNSGSIIGNGTKTLIRNHAKKVILLSGTPNNGYASSIYNILFALIPNKLFENNIHEEKDFITAYGTLQAVTKQNDDRRTYYHSGRAEIKDSDFKEIEGINPLVFTKYLGSNFITADLTDIAENLPKFNEYYIPIEHNDYILSCEHRFYEDIKKINPFNSKMYKDSVIKHFTNNPFKWNGIFIECGGKSDTVKPINYGNDIILPKEYELINIIKKELSEGRKCWIYTDFNNGGEYMKGETITKRIIKLLKDEDIDVFELKASVSTYDRKDVIDKNKDAYDIFIGNRKLTSVGLNLQFCPTYINYMPSYMVNDVSQANRRGMRANSTMENRVYNLYYKNSCEQDIIERYQRKVSESNAIMGRFDVTLESEDVRTASKFSAIINKNIV